MRLVIAPLLQSDLALEQALTLQIVGFLDGLRRLAIAPLLRIFERALGGDHVLICALELGRALRIGGAGRNSQRKNYQQEASHPVLTGLCGTGSRASGCKIFS